MSNQYDAPRPSSLRSLVAEYFVLSFREYPDDLKYSALRSNSGEELREKEDLPFVRRMKQLLWWPPDIFALTSTVLSRTGAYRMVAGPRGRIGKKLWQSLDWQLRVGSHSEAWRSSVSSLLLSPAENTNPGNNNQRNADINLWDEIEDRVNDRCSRRHLEKLQIDVEDLELNLLEILNPLKKDPETFPDKDRTYNLLKIFIGYITQLEDRDGPLADQNLLAVSVKADRYNHFGKNLSDKKAAKFFEALIGLHILADAASESIGVPRSSTQECAVFDAFANTMLTLRGSLSTSSKFYGVVLPKLHTPQSGLTLRNLSHNLTFHNCEVEVMWRSFPWSNFDENTLNILYVPYPFDFDPNRFKTETEHYESVGYFTYDPGDWKGVGNVVKLIDDIQKNGINTHMLVFTETAFNEDTYKRLLTALSQRYGSEDPKQMPIVVAGVAKTENNLPYNELRLATYFAGKWYQLSQHKHHRWQLNTSQINQYNLQGHLSTARPLFERSVMDQRRLTFYAPTPWLVLSPLICEDLSRIEPVSELIRGVGPTLVLALLLDGPQLAERWPGRYASVLADDPGTGVLTVTSYGSAKASRPESMKLDPISENDSSGSHQKVASWKDPSSSFQPISTAENEALLLTLTAHLGRQFTLDRRESRGKAASFRLDGIKRFKMPENQCDQGIDRRLDSLGNWSDIREVTAITYIASAALSILRPHYSKHPDPKEAEGKTDTWRKIAHWETRGRNVRKLIDTMLGRPLQFKSILDKGKEKEWSSLIQKEISRINKGKINRSEKYRYYVNLKATRNVLLNHLFNTSKSDENSSNQLHLVHNRHLFAVLAYSQTTIDVEVRDNEAKWPTDSLRYSSTVLRVIFDTIAGIDFLEDSQNSSAWEKASEVYLSRLRIAGRENRDKTVLWNAEKPENSQINTSIHRDVVGAPKTLLEFEEEKGQVVDQPFPRIYHEINYLKQFNSTTGIPDFPPDDITSNKDRKFEVIDHPNRYDYYRMILAIINAILIDTNASLWKRCQSEFTGHIGEIEMRRLTLLVLMLIPSLIHEQLEYDYIRIRRNDEIAIKTKVIRKLIKEAEAILKSAAVKTGTTWNPRQDKY